jgi:hypothetical protein
MLLIILETLPATTSKEIIVSLYWKIMSVGLAPFVQNVTKHHLMEDGECCEKFTDSITIVEQLDLFILPGFPYRAILQY